MRLVIFQRPYKEKCESEVKLIGREIYNRHAECSDTCAIEAFLAVYPDYGKHLIRAHRRSCRRGVQAKCQRSTAEMPYKIQCGKCYAGGSASHRAARLYHEPLCFELCLELMRQVCVGAYS